MTQALFDIIFRGDLLPGHGIAEVKAQLAALFKADVDRINALFSGRAVALKRNIDRASGEKYVAVLRRVGADVELVNAGSVNVAPARSRPPATRPANADQQPAAVSPALPVAGLALRPAGADLLDAAERQQPAAVAVDTSHLSLRPQEGNLVDSEELWRPAAVVVADNDFGLSEVGADLLLASERQKAAPAPVPVPQVDLAPPGSDLGQKKAGPAPAPPDTSGISIAPLE